MWQVVAEAGILALDFVYHRWIDPPAFPKIPPGQKLTIPRTDAGAPLPMIFGKVRVEAPVLAFTGKAIATADVDGGFIYSINMGFGIGIPFTGSDSQNSLWNVWVGDVLCSTSNRVVGGPYPIPGSGDFKIAAVALTSPIGSGGNYAGPFVEFLDGRSTQQLVDSSGTAQNFAGTIALNAGIPAAAIPGYRGILFATCYNEVLTDAWLIGMDPNVPSYSFEVSSYPLASLGPAGGKIADMTDPAKPQYDANPIDVIYDLLTGSYGKLGLDPSKLDIGAFTAAAVTIHNEGHGYSRAFDGGRSAKDTIQEILKQIDATLYTNPATGLITIKLIRPDYDPNTIPNITPDNCKELQNFSFGGWMDAPNKVRIAFNSRVLYSVQCYGSSSVLAINGASVAQNGTSELQIEMLGVTNVILARQLAARELAAQARPLAKCTAIVNRSFYNVCPGDAVSVTWPEANLSGLVFRVAAVDRGTLANGQIKLDLIQDYFYQWRDQRPVNPGFPGGFTGSRSAE